MFSGSLNFVFNFFTWHTCIEHLHILYHSVTVAFHCFNYSIVTLRKDRLLLLSVQVIIKDKCKIIRSSSEKLNWQPFDLLTGVCRNCLNLAPFNHKICQHSLLIVRCTIILIDSQKLFLCVTRNGFWW